MEQLVEAGLIARWGVSNLDTDDMGELFDAGGEACATNQILYNLTRRGPEFDLLPWLKRCSIPVMAYSPVEQGRLLDRRALLEMRSVTPPAPPRSRWPGSSTGTASCRSPRLEPWSM
jgi:diketogulonate reductase-like aldo/keto reductase